MAAITAHDLVRRFNSGGIITIADATDVLTMQHLAKDSVNYKPAGRETLPVSDRGVYEAPLDGDDTLGEFSFDCFGLYTSAFAKDLAQLYTAARTTNRVPEFTIVVKWPAYRGASTGASVTLTGCSFMEAPTLKQSDSNGDTWSAKFSFRSTGGLVTY